MATVSNFHRTNTVNHRLSPVVTIVRSMAKKSRPTGAALRFLRTNSFSPEVESVPPVPLSTTQIQVGSLSKTQDDHFEHMLILSDIWTRVGDMSVGRSSHGCTSYSSPEPGYENSILPKEIPVTHSLNLKHFFRHP